MRGQRSHEPSHEDERRDDEAPALADAMTNEGPQRHEDHRRHEEYAEDDAEVRDAEDVAREVRRGCEHGARSQGLEDEGHDENAEGACGPCDAELLLQGVLARSRLRDVAAESAYDDPAREHGECDERSDGETHEQVAGVLVGDQPDDDGRTDAEEKDSDDLESHTPRHERGALPR